MMRSPSPPRISQQANRSNVESPHSQPPVKRALEGVEARGHFSFSSGCRLRPVPAIAPHGPWPHGNQGTVKLIILNFPPYIWMSTKLSLQVYSVPDYPIGGIRFGVSELTLIGLISP